MPVVPRHCCCCTQHPSGGWQRACWHLTPQLCAPFIDLGLILTLAPATCRAQALLLLRLEHPASIRRLAKGLLSPGYASLAGEEDGEAGDGGMMVDADLPDAAGKQMGNGSEKGLGTEQVQPKETWQAGSG